MTKRNLFTLFELTFWPAIGLASQGLLTLFLRLDAEMSAFILIGTVGMSTMQVCQLDVAYALLFDMWSKSVKHQFLAPIRGTHLVLGAGLMGMGRGVIVFVLMAFFSLWGFEVPLFRPGVALVLLFLLGLFLNGLLVGTLVCTLILFWGPRAEVAAWSAVSVVFVLAGVYYPVSLLPSPLDLIARLIPLTHILEAFRAPFGFPGSPGMSFALGLGLSLLYCALSLLLLERALTAARRTGTLLRLSE